MAVSVAFSGNSSQTSGGAAQTLGNSGAAITTAGVYGFYLETSLLANGTTPDIIEVRIYGKGSSGATERLLDVHTLVGAQSTSFLSKPYGSPISVRFEVTQTQGTSRALPYGIWLYA